MSAARIIAQLLALLLFSTEPYAQQIIPPNRVTTWLPGLMAVGGIPVRTTIFKTLSPRGGALDDTAQIQAALDTCPANQVVQLTAGTFNITGNGLTFVTENCTLRGAGPGGGASGGNLGNDSASRLIPGGTGTYLVKVDRNTNLSFAILYIGNDPSQFSTSINLAADAALGTNSVTLASNPGIQVGEIVLVDQITNSNPDVFWGPSHDAAGGGSRRWFIRQDRSLNQMMEVTAVSGNTITFATPFHTTFKTADLAQLSRYTQPVLRRIGIEDISFFGGMGGDYHGNVSMNSCAYCWIKNIEAFWSVGTSVGLYGTYRSELRDSYIHETPQPDPGGAGYMVGLNYGASDNLVENNIMWNGNKGIVMRGTGGGNVVAYNYLDDTFGSNYPNQPEAGLNAGHYTTPHMELLEGNYSHNYKGDSYWGNSIDITVFRNQLSGIRAGAPPLDTYMFGIYPYMDLEGRTAVDVQAYSYRTNFVGNVLGFQGQTLLSYNKGGYAYTQSSWAYEMLNAFTPDGTVTMWTMGADQSHVNIDGNWAFVPTTYQTQLRQGNWDWSTQSQRWHGIGGAVGAGTPLPIPNSLYLASKPAFFGSNAWPWVDPSTGFVSLLPAKDRFAQISRTVKKSTTTALISSLNPSGTGQSVTFTATVTASGVPTGIVTFKDGALTLGAAAVAGGSATFSTAALTVGSHQITATYGGDSTFSESTSGILSQAVNPTIATTTILDANSNPSIVGQSVTLTATVTSTAGLPTGFVTFKDGSTTLGTGSLSGGTAAFSTSALAQGSHPLTAVYAGGTGFTGSTSATLTQVVNLTGLVTTASITSNPNPSTAAKPVTLTATVTASNGTPTGTVTFKDGRTVIGVGTLSGGSATFSAATLAVGSHALTAVYGGASGFSGSTSGALTQVVNPYAGLAEVVSMTSSLSLYSPPVRLESPAKTATATVVLLPGGTGLLSLDAAGVIQSNGDDTLMRSANAFLLRGLNVVLADSAPAFPSGLATTDRLSNPHLSQVVGIVTAAASRWGLPVWVVGFGNSSVSAIASSTNLQANPMFKGLILASPLTDFSSNPNNQALFNTYVSLVTSPALVLWHATDGCPVSTPVKSAALLTALPSTTKAGQAFDGGHSVLVEPCSAFAKHGFAGIETAPIDAIATFIAANPATGQLGAPQEAAPGISARTPTSASGAVAGWDAR